MICKLLQLVFTAVAYGELRARCHDVAANGRGGDLDVSLEDSRRAQERMLVRQLNSSETLSDYAGAQLDPLLRKSESRLVWGRPGQPL